MHAWCSSYTQSQPQGTDPTEWWGLKQVAAGSGPQDTAGRGCGCNPERPQLSLHTELLEARLT